VQKIVAFFVRHGETDLNESSEKLNGAKERYRGDMDIPLNEIGRQEAEELVPYFAARNFSAAFHSGMRRTSETLSPLMEAKGMKSMPVPDFNNLDTGDFTGLPKSKKNKKAMDFYRAHTDVQIPGGESVDHFRDRVDPKIMMAIEIGDESGEPTITAAHASVMRELARILRQDYKEIKVEPSGVVGVFKSSQGYQAKALLKPDVTEEEIRPGS
jgi:broad specificity phosphatase PhoE